MRHITWLNAPKHFRGTSIPFAEPWCTKPSNYCSTGNQNNSRATLLTRPLLVSSIIHARVLLTSLPVSPNQNLPNCVVLSSGRSLIFLNVFRPSNRNGDQLSNTPLAMPFITIPSCLPHAWTSSSAFLGAKSSSISRLGV